jgi:hypothetical protein
VRQHRSMCKHVTRELSTRYMFIEPREVSRCQEQGNHLAITTAHRVHTPQARAGAGRCDLPRARMRHEPDDDMLPDTRCAG